MSCQGCRLNSSQFTKSDTGTLPPDRTEWLSPRSKKLPCPSRKGRSGLSLLESAASRCFCRDDEEDAERCEREIPTEVGEVDVGWLLCMQAVAASGSASLSPLSLAAPSLLGPSPSDTLDMEGCIRSSKLESLDMSWATWSRSSELSASIEAVRTSVLRKVSSRSAFSVRSFKCSASRSRYRASSSSIAEEVVSLALLLLCCCSATATSMGKGGGWCWMKEPGVAGPTAVATKAGWG
mmetsp:Transcript_48325/g.103531  ORF Transcript_48325/g.103531 Transcript_48325/m.103531 type:complete len:237 (+) Transcript_48325:196-906(+)